MDYSDLDAVTWPYQLTNVVHREMYPLLEPSQPQLSAKGKTIIITGATGGVGKVNPVFFFYARILHLLLH